MNPKAVKKYVCEIFILKDNKTQLREILKYQINLAISYVQGLDNSPAVKMPVLSKLTYRSMIHNL